MNIYRNIHNNRLYKIFKVTPAKYLGYWYEREDLISGDVDKIKSLDHYRQAYYY